MNSSKKAQFCAICGRNHDPNIPCASATSFDALGEMGDTKSREKDKGSYFKDLSHKTDKIMILVAIFLVLIIIILKIV